MKTYLFSVSILVLISFSGQAQSLSGKEIFAGNCKACHSIGGGTLVGPDLAGVTERREKEWIKSFITNSQKMVAEGDIAAVEVFNQFHKIAMPSHNFNEEDMNSLIGYMEEAGKEISSAKEKEQLKENSTTSQNPEETMASLGKESEMPWFFKTIMGFLGVTTIILVATAGYLYRLLKS